MSSVDLGHLLFQGDVAPDPGSQYYTFTDPTLPALRGFWRGGSTTGVMAGRAGFFGINFARTTEAFLEWPRDYRREREWVRYVRQDVTCAGFTLWMSNFRTPPTRITARWADAATLLLEDDFGGSGVAHAQSESLIGDDLYNLEVGFWLR